MSEEIKLSPGEERELKRFLKERHMVVIDVPQDVSPQKAAEMALEPKGYFAKRSSARIRNRMSEEVWGESIPKFFAEIEGALVKYEEERYMGSVSERALVKEVRLFVHSITSSIREKAISKSNTIGKNDLNISINPHFSGNYKPFRESQKRYMAALEEELTQKVGVSYDLYKSVLQKELGRIEVDVTNIVYSSFAKITGTAFFPTTMHGKINFDKLEVAPPVEISAGSGLVKTTINWVRSVTSKKKDYLLDDKVDQFFSAAQNNLQGFKNIFAQSSPGSADLVLVDVVQNAVQEITKNLKLDANNSEGLLKKGQIEKALTLYFGEKMAGGMVAQERYKEALRAEYIHICGTTPDPETLEGHKDASGRIEHEVRYILESSFDGIFNGLTRPGPTGMRR